MCVYVIEQIEMRKKGIWRKEQNEMGMATAKALHLEKREPKINWTEIACVALNNNNALTYFCHVNFDLLLSLLSQFKCKDLLCVYVIEMWDK